MTNAITNISDISFAPVIEVPTVAPSPSFDISNPMLTFDDIMVSRFFSMEKLKQWCKERGVDNRVLTVSRITVEYIFNPKNEKPDAGTHRPCLHFVECDSMLVLNPTRVGQVKSITNSPLLAHAAKMGQIMIRADIYNGKAQIGIEPLPRNYTPQESNLELYGFD